MFARTPLNIMLYVHFLSHYFLWMPLNMRMEVWEESVNKLENYFFSGDDVELLFKLG
jgi:hypothetical protein